ncbi:MAG TPA: division/cell wall cluster transcriptional repressor MraZ [Rubrivivax sp.]|jgi:MraZ protein|nr:division/cell wall cluster transcriptional repressor MraZ [Betaproteobacteria bacterium]MBP6317597.1 division/cell wall cluster transcriptional repressor MraZ [Rubrivivax sp.]MBK7459579.1 division/cell wall cluster transcriptional repressor MraZ [Betaproteobacteria bacterium]MBK7517725.1 division/cell wall cluster transcriptional repressor MraZ [Betaproteobacteria bacterium]MBK8105490.1 division/cell wall cluster transcriptional repressor MraZ [Betaproteobacteria bacterium]
MVFRGGPVLTLDGKGRITVPVRWRDMLVATVQGQLVVAKNPDGCLSLYPLPVWEQFEASLLSLTTEDEAWRRFFVGSATEVEIDSASRVLIPPELRSWAGLEREVKFMGVGPNFELWDMARYEAREAEVIARGRPEALRTLVIR